MLPEMLRSESVPNRRPIVSDVTEDETGRSFTVHFAPFQRLLDHKNRARIVIMAITGRGILTVEGMDPREIVAGDVVQVDPNVVHAVESLEEPLELQVVLRANCCGSC